ncbi:hypothetical protein BJ508DRAFT_418441 [Ascobolus immersus RN42]|uniref:GPI transamidase component PIG-S n=1 Tax=Ascobolus immersus RN42 TaxID=1160509 RepID=A0A3N4HLU4_ASCIM|nr:hypothetical protein BJ508DRAFT_418441 [Ascobolus immersus RN42]
MSLNPTEKEPLLQDESTHDVEPVDPAKVIVTTAQKQPPPEDLPSIKRRINVLLSFWVVVIFLGIPLWWVTTSIYRAPLPITEMQNWAEGRACRVEFPLLVEVESLTLPEPESLLKSVQHALDDANDFSAHHIRLRLAKTNNGKEKDEKEKSKKGTNKSTEDSREEVAATLRLIPGEKGSTKHSYALHPWSRTIDILYSPTHKLNPSSAASVANLSSFIALTLQEIFSEEQQMITHLLGTSGVSPSTTTPLTTTSTATNGSGGPPGKAPVDITRKISRIVRYVPKYHITISLFTATGVPRSWDIVSSLESHFQPLLAALSPLSTFTIDTQIQYYASFSPSVQPVWNEDLKAFTLAKEDLSSFINSAEWPLTFLGEGTAINFIVYIPSPSQSPLLIPSSPTNSFLIPQWGGVAIFNPPTQPPVLDQKTLKPLMHTFSTQLLSLLGAPSYPPSLPLSLRLDSLTRQRSAELLVSASSTLGSLARLTKALPSIAIPATVLSSVQTTLQNLQTTCDELKVGNFNAALRAGRIASEEAEKAFFERTMVSQVYFPEEHKVAVYLPLLGPVGVPLVMGAVRGWREWRARKKALGV